MGHFALSALGRDRPGIVAALTRVLLDHAVNIEDSQATILRGHFAMMLIVAAPDTVDRDRLRADLDAVAWELGLEALSLRDVDQLDRSGPEPSHMVAVYGLDHPGIVHVTTRVLAERGIDITDLNTRLVGDAPDQPLYALMMEVALPPGESVDELRGALAAIAEREGVEVSLRELEQDAL
jgi:glycine cleavage system transcriptional repressor